MKKPVIEFEHFSFQYDAQKEPTLRDICLVIHEGEKVLIAGPSGSGKSTVAHCINGLIPFSYKGASTGSLKIQGQEAKGESIFALSKKVGTVLQDPDGQFIGLTVGEDIAFALENDCVDLPQMRETVGRAAQMVDIDGQLSSAPHELSGGQKQRVSLAGVLVDNVGVLLFDEPLANLDPATGKQAIELIDRVQKELGATVVIIEHRLEDALYRPVDRIVLMAEGRIVADAAPNELLASGLLAEYGIREPLYLTLLRYAGCAITPLMMPENVDTMMLEGCTPHVSAWYERAGGHEEAPGSGPMIEVRDVRFRYDTGGEVLHGVSFAVRRGEMMSIVGKNGAGKSTISKLICGFEKLSKGRILFEGRDMAGDTIRERAGNIGMVMQNPNQMISKNMIFDEVALGLRVRGLGEAEVKERVEHVLGVCGLHPFRNWPISALSFGQKKRVTIATILALDPKVLLLDEPTAGQDFRHYTEIMEFLLGLNRSGVTVVLITHDMHLMLEYTNRCVVFAEGEIIADAPPAQVLCDAGIVGRANLKETSLYTLCERTIGVEPGGFVQRFIDDDRRRRRR